MTATLVFGMIIGLSFLVYASVKGVSQDERDAIQKEKDEEEKGNILSKDVIQQQKIDAREALKENLYRMNPDLRNLSEEELLATIKERKSTFLDKMAPDAREKFVDYAENTKAELEKMSRLSPNEIRRRASAVEANEFRVCLLKFLVLFAIVYIFCAINFETGSLFTIYERATSDWQAFTRSGVNEAHVATEQLVDL